jgi:hypothetical protein
MFRPLFSKVDGRSLALTSESCDGLARHQSERVWGLQISSMKLSSHSSRNAKLRPISKRKLSSFARSLKDRSATDRHVYEVSPRKDHLEFDLISDVLRSGRLWYDTPNNAIGYAMHSSRSHTAVIRVYDSGWQRIETHEHKGEFKEP